jgi:plasmid stabilization system protein ParE
MKVRYTRSAARQLDGILTYISERSPQGGAKVKARIKDLISLIASHPRIGAITADPSIRRMNALPYPYLIFYEIGEGEIIIRRVRHMAQKPD